MSTTVLGVDCEVKVGDFITESAAGLQEPLPNNKQMIYKLRGISLGIELWKSAQLWNNVTCPVLICKYPAVKHTVCISIHQIQMQNCSLSQG